MTLNAQIKKPKLDNTSIDTDLLDQSVKGLKVKNLDKMSVKDFAKLKIPVSILSKDILNKEPTRSWVITPLKLNDAHLKFISSDAYTSQESWQFGYVLNPRDYLAFKFTISFRVTGGVEYRLKLKNVGRPINVSTDRVIIAIDNGVPGELLRLISAEHSSNGEFYFVFKEDRSRNIKIKINGIFSPGRIEITNNITLKEVRIDRIN